jgi:outer membrane protein
MRLTTRTALVVLLIAAIAAPMAQAEGSSSSAAQSSQAATPGQAPALSLAKARQLTLERSSALRKAQLAVDGAALSKQSQVYSALPSLSASAGTSLDWGGNVASLEEGLGASAKLSASETIFDGGKNAALIKKAELSTQAARQSLSASRISLIGSADSAFFALLEAQASLEAASSDLDAAKLRLGLAKAKAEAGALSKSDYLQSESEAASYETALIKAKKTLSTARAKLASLTGLSASVEPEKVDFAAYESLLAKLSAMDDAAIDKLAASIAALAKANSPSLAGYALAKEGALLAVAAAKASYLPTVSAGVGQSLAFGSSSISASGSLSLSASMSLDLWSVKNSVDSASVTAREAELEGKAQEESLELEVGQALYEWVASACAIGSSEKALEYAQSSYDNVLEKFKLSSATASDLSDAEAALSKTKTALIAARYAFLSDLSTLRSLAGLEDESKIAAMVL